MQTLSTALRNAVDAGNPQRVLLVFTDQEFSNEDILISSGVELNEKFNSEEDLTIGLTPSNILTFTMLNDTGQLAEFEFGWFTAYLGARIDSGTPTEITRTFTEGGATVTYAFAPIGTFYADRPKIVVKKTIEVTAYDQMLLFDEDMPTSASLGITYPTTVGGIFQKMCDHFNITPKATNFLNNDLVVSSEPEDFGMATMRQVLGWIAECGCGNARFTRDGKLEIAWFNTTSKTYNERKYSEFSPAWYETEAINGLYYRNTSAGTETTNGTVKTNNYLLQDNPFLN